MNEEPVVFNAGPLRLEGLYAEAGGEKGAVISHPHPQMGGDMMNNVVETLVSALFAAGFSTLRFNFRGVGASEGRYDDGRGEQDDVRGAIAFLREKGKKEIMLAGYSFGAWISAKVLAAADDLLPVVFVAPPLALLAFDVSALTGKVGLVLCGDRDDFCSPEKLRIMAEQAGCRLEIIRGADHFFLGHEREIAGALEKFVSERVPRSLLR